MNNLYGAAAPLLCLKTEKAGSEEPAIHGIIKYDQTLNTPQKLYRTW